MIEKWNILVVDDEKDVHQITELTLKRSRWRGRSFALTSAFSGESAKEMLANPENSFHVALVDVVMESSHAGLELCNWMRTHLPRTVRIILRTGQPGMAPEEQILHQYDIDFYLAKTEVTSERLFATLRACLRSSQDVATMLALGNQLQGLAKTLRNGGTLDDMMFSMRETLRFIELKHAVKLGFLCNLGLGAEFGYLSVVLRGAASPLTHERVQQALSSAHEKGLATGTLHDGAAVGLEPQQSLLLTSVQQHAGAYADKPKLGRKVVDWFKGKAMYEDQTPVKGGVVVEFSEELSDQRARDDFLYDMRLFLDNWNLVYSIVLVQENLARAKAMDAKAF